MNDRLSNFVAEHPEFFELCNGYWRLKKDLSPLMERYAHAVNREEFERLRTSMEEFRQKERQRLQKEIDDWIVERERETIKIAQTDKELADIRKKDLELEKKITKLRVKIDSRVVETAKWYHSGFTFLALALVGLICLYLGIILNRKVSPGYVLSGLFCIILGFYLQSSTPGEKGQDASGPQLQMLLDEQRRYRQIAKIKIATLNERKRFANKGLNQLNAKIDNNLAKIDTLYG